MNGELAGCDFKWEFSPTRADQVTFYSTITQPTIGCLTLLLENQARLVQLLEAKDQEIQDYTLNGAVLSRKSLQTTIFDPKKETLIIPSSPEELNLMAGLKSPEYSMALNIFRKSEKTKDGFVEPGPTTTSKIENKDKINSSFSTATSVRKRDHLAASSTASVMKAPKPMQSNKKQSGAIPESNSPGASHVIGTDNSSARQQLSENCSSPQQIKRTRASRTSINAPKHFLKKL